MPAEEHPDEMELDKYVRYFEKTYTGSYENNQCPMGNAVRLVWKEAKFRPQMWSLHERTLQ